MRKIAPIILGLIILLASCGSDEGKTSKDDLNKLKEQQKELNAKIALLEKQGAKTDGGRKIAVQLTPMYPTVFNTYLELQGRVDAGESVNATPEAPGVVQSIRVSNGQFVHKGQVLATLKAETIQNGMAELDVQIAFAKTLYDKQKSLWAQEIGTEIQLLSAKNNYESLLKKKSTIRSQRNMYTINAPISGIVDDVNLHVGDMASPGMPNQIRIVNTAAVKVLVDIPESYAGKVNTGSKVMVILPDAMDTLLTSVKYVQKTIDPVKRTFKAEINPSSAGGLRPNMIAQVKIATYSTTRAFVLPAKVIQHINGEDFVFVANGQDKAVLKKVTLGQNYRGSVEISTGLVLDDRVVTVGYEELNEGDKLSYSK